MIFVSEMYKYYSEVCKYFSLQVRMADLTSSLVYLTYTSFLSILFDVSKNIDLKVQHT